MLYHLIRPVARYVLRHYYRHIDITGLEHIPTDAPVILAANHPTAFIEPCLLACFQHRTLHFLARGDLYKNGLAAAVLKALNILPVYRLKDGGYSKLKHNFSTFEDCFKVLSNRGAVMILAEGSCVHEKALRPLRKGTARIALGALDADVTLEEVYVVPVGVNFTRPEKMRSQVLIRCGAPMRASEYLADYRANPTPALTNFTRHLRARLNPLVVQFPAPELAAIGELRLEVDRAAHETATQTGVTHKGSQLDRELQLAQSIAERPTATALAAELREHQLSLPPRTTAALTGGHLLRLAIGVLLLLPLVPVLALAQWIAATRPKTIEFYSPVRFAAVAVGLLVWVPLVIIFTPWAVKAWVILSLLTVGWAMRQVEIFSEHVKARRWVRLTPTTRKRVLELYNNVLGQG